MGVKGLKCMLLWDSARLFAAMACIKSGLSSTEKLKSNETLYLPNGNLVWPFSLNSIGLCTAIYGTNDQIEHTCRDLPKAYL